MSDYIQLGKVGEPIIILAAPGLEHGLLAEGYIIAVGEKARTDDILSPDGTWDLNIPAIEAEFREARKAKFLVHDEAILQAQRDLRAAGGATEEAPIVAYIAALDAYAKALCDLPTHPGYPWLSVGDIEWPTFPVKPY